ncbi:MAG: molecular chaperone DnaJ [Bacteroidia bacterium]|nr:TerB family tellurite resistance protein [Paludibacter sp.]NCB67355.1 molecular chaperone DnaJ [Bacteroidia bacterium]
MAGFGKWLAGGLGLVLGGPMGAIIGFALGSLFEGSSTSSSQQGTHSRTTRSTSEGDFKMSLLVMIACVMKADGNVQKAELNVVKRFLVTNFGEDGALEALQILKRLLDQPLNEREMAMQINQFMNYSAKLQLVHFLFDVAYSDGHVNAAELRVIQTIASIFRITAADFESLKAPYVKNVDKDWAYKALEIEPSATIDEIKKAYRRMAMKYHPDKVNSLGEDVKKSATEKFRAINEAYEQLKKDRSFV